MRIVFDIYPQRDAWGRNLEIEELKRQKQEIKEAIKKLERLKRRIRK